MSFILSSELEKVFFFFIHVIHWIFVSVNNQNLYLLSFRTKSSLITGTEESKSKGGINSDSLLIVKTCPLSRQSGKLHDSL